MSTPETTEPKIPEPDEFNAERVRRMQPEANVVVAELLAMLDKWPGQIEFERVKIGNRFIYPRL